MSARRPPTLGGGTDAGSMLLFDPAVLPDDYDQTYLVDPLGPLRRLQADGRLVRLNLGGDGHAELVVYTGGVPPADLAGYAPLRGSTPRFSAPSGALYFAGVEYAFRKDDSQLLRNPLMGSRLDIPPGTYRLTLYEPENPDTPVDDALRRRLPPAAYRRYRRTADLIPLCVAAALTFGAAFAVLPFIFACAYWWHPGLLPASLAYALLAFALSRTRPYRVANRLRRALEKAHPDYVAVLEPCPDV